MLRHVLSVLGDERRRNRGVQVRPSCLRRVLALEGLEDRTLLSASVLPAAAGDDRPGQWSTATLPVGGNYTAMTVDNKAVFVGGNGYSVSVYDASNGQWSSFNLPFFAGGSGFARLAAAVGNKVLVMRAGDAGLHRAAVDFFDVDTGQWSRSPVTITDRGDLTAVTVGSKVLIAGGSRGGTVYDEVDVYDASNDSWSTAKLSVPDVSRDIQATAVGGKALFVHGGVADVYDDSTGRWSTVTLSTTHEQGAVVTAGTKAFFAGGLGRQGLINAVDVYDAATGRWSTASLSQARRYLSAVAVGNKVLFAGGLGGQFGSDPSRVVDVYDTGNGQWSTASLSVARAFIGVTAVGDRAVFAGGSRDVDREVNTAAVDVYDAGTGGWYANTLSQVCTSPAATAAGTKAFFVGTSTAVEVYDLTPASVGLDRSTVSLFKPSIAAGTAIPVTLTVRDPSGRQLSSAGLSVAFALKPGSVGGTFGPVKDNHDGTYTAVFTAGGTAGTALITATIGGQALTSAPAALTVTPPGVTLLQTAGTLSVARDQVAVASVGTRVIFAGGEAYGVSSDAIDVYDSATGRWSTARLSRPRTSPAAVTVGNKVLFVGGIESTDYSHGAYSDAVDVYDAATGRWSAARLPVPGNSPNPGLLGNGVVVGNKAFFIGGLDPSGYYCTVVYVYDAATGQWSSMPLPATLYYDDVSTAVVLGTRAIFVGNGGDPSHGDSHLTADVYDTATGQWTTGELSAGRYSGWGGTLTAVVAGSKALVSYGSDGSVDVYDPHSGWSPASLSVPRSDLTVATVGTKVLFAGGIAYGGPSKAVDVYDAATNQWSTASLSVGRSTMTAVTVGNQVVFAGAGRAAGPSDAVDVYDDATGRWQAASLSVPGYDMKGLAFGSRAIFYGGISDFLSTIRYAVDVYDASTGQWATDILAIRDAAGAVTRAGDAAVIAGGHDGADYHPSNVAAVFKLTPPTVSLSLSAVRLSQSAVAAGASVTVTLTARDAASNPMTGLVIAFKLAPGSVAGTFGPVRDNHDGTYTATFTAGGVVGTARITATIGGQALTSAPAALSVNPGPVSLAGSPVTLSRNPITVNSSVTVTLLAKDAFGNPLPGLAVAFRLTPGSAGGTFGPVTDNHDGTYTATFTANGTVGSDGITAAVTGRPLTSGPAVLTVKAGVTYDAASQFSLTSNPAGPWSYGVRLGLQSPFTPLTQKATSGSFAGWARLAGQPPAVSKNVAGPGLVPRDGLTLLASQKGESPVVRWTSPAAGTYLIETSFTGVYPLPDGTEADVHVLVNGTPVFDGFVRQKGSVSYSKQLTLKAGDTVEFVVGPGAAASSWDRVILGARITSFAAG